MITYYGEKAKVEPDPLLYSFHAAWCAPCRLTTTNLFKYHDEHPDLNIVRVDVDKFPEVAEAYGVQSLPTLIYYKNEEEQWRHIGLMTYKQIEEKFNGN